MDFNENDRLKELNQLVGRGTKIYCYDKGKSCNKLQ
jgi:hypothetical protein